jgi:hypothetical protein
MEKGDKRSAVKCRNEDRFGKIPEEWDPIAKSVQFQMRGGGECSQ